MKIIKCSLAIIGLLFLALVVFYFWGSSGVLAEKDHQTVIQVGEATKPTDTLTIMTYNLGYLSGMKNNLAVEMPEELFDENLEKAQTLIKEYNPDIIGFQEIDFASSRSWNRNQLDSLSKSYHQAYRSINWDKRYVPFPYWPLKHHFGKMLSGQAILSKFPLSNEETVVLEKPINAPFYYNKFYLDRLVQLADVTIGDRTVKVMNVHLEAFDPETTESQAEVVKELYESYADKMPVLLIGDFNSSPSWANPEDKALEIIKSARNLESAIRQPKDSKNDCITYTFSTGEPEKSIDHIFYTPDSIELIEWEVLRDVGEISDHFPLLMKFTFTSKNDSTISE